MSFIEAEGTLLGANMKKGGKMILQIEVTQDLDSREDYYHLRKMIEKNVKFSLSSQVVNYNIEINARTEKPIKSYRVDENGVVSEVKPEGEQLELDLGVPKQEEPVEEVPQEISRTVVEEFILSLLAPDYPDMPYPFYDWVLRLNDGETYSRLASECDMSSGKIVEIIDEYCKRIAPLASKWDEWRQGKVEAEPAPKDEETVRQDVPDDELDYFEKEILGVTEGQQYSGNSETDQGEATDGREMDFANDQQDPEEETLTYDDGAGDVEISNEAVEEYILQNRPVFPDADLDFPALVEQRRNGETWMGISREIGIPSSQLSSKFRKYKDYVKKLMKDGGAA